MVTTKESRSNQVLIDIEEREAEVIEDYRNYMTNKN